MTEPRPLTVEQLIAKLQTCPPDALVQTEGCDCWGNAADVRVAADPYNATYMKGHEDLHGRTVVEILRDPVETT